ncbi:hypothetical protein M501DRAFT_1001566 [Patellaria atrata CBS 101060]|uniref:Uncharacterized protein n=1 Tax=Patellaria atrata CBS 101060 TaxID=1346257 RepID=A0A9P4SD87_9PEZI|nr:hypothetical protein M501DRAFT_1001566 [Patellaria atrata CBS 101060]
MATDMDMDIDMDIDLGDDGDIAAMEAEAMKIETQPDQPDYDVQHDVDITEVTSSDVVPTKVHIRGLDNFTSADVKGFAGEHYPLDHYQRVEWIDDTSANILYETAEAATEALNAFSNFTNIDPNAILLQQLRPAKHLSSHPETPLQVRQALVTDVKKPRAHEASRFYLLHPDKDPRERRKQGGRGRGRRGSQEGGEYRRNRFDDREHRRRRDGDKFDVSMYDDDGGEGASSRANGSRRDSVSGYSSSDNDRRRRRVRFGDKSGGDLFSDRNSQRSNGRLRDRSASPTLDGDGRLGFEEDESSVRRKIRQRSLTPPCAALRNGNAVKELFPSSSNSRKELFPGQTSPNKTKELFPHKTAISNHRRTGAMDTHAPEKTDLFANGSSTSKYGRLGSRPSTADTTHSEGFTIRGTATQQPVGQPELSIKGASQVDSPVKELFPSRNGHEGKELFIKGISNAGKELFGRNSGKELFSNNSGKELFGSANSGKELFGPANSGKELFADKLSGRGAPRRKAQDLFP